MFLPGDLVQLTCKHLLCLHCLAAFKDLELPTNCCNNFITDNIAFDANSLQYSLSTTTMSKCHKITQFPYHVSANIFTGRFNGNEALFTQPSIVAKDFQQSILPEVLGQLIIQETVDRPHDFATIMGTTTDPCGMLS
ncbi:hypothetical protein P9112_008308 [Eukaryota sp. TZLM1-RC]